MEQSTATHTALEQLVVAPPWEAYSIDAASFPIAEERFERIRQAMVSLSAVLSTITGVSPELFLQVSQLHVDGGASRFASHARDWAPTMGLGIFPDRDPPRTWRSEDFENMEPGMELRPMCHKVFQLAITGTARQAAWQSMFGRGVTLQIYANPPAADTVRQMSRLFLPSIEDKVFRRYPFLVTLFDRKILEGATAEQLQRWSCGLSAYVRESAEDRSILIASRIPLRKAIEAAGLDSLALQ